MHAQSKVATFELQLFSHSAAIGILLSLKTVYTVTLRAWLIKTFDYTVKLNPFQIVFARDYSCSCFKLQNDPICSNNILFGYVLRISWKMCSSVKDILVCPQATIGCIRICD